MPVVLGFAALLRWNYLRSLAGKSTFCSFSRRHLSPAAFLALLAAGLLWFVPHFLNPILERPLMVPEFLRRMPSKILFGTAKGIETWCANEGVQRPTLLDLSNARAARGGKRRR